MDLWLKLFCYVIFNLSKLNIFKLFLILVIIYSILLWIQRFSFRQLLALQGFICYLVHQHTSSLKIKVAYFFWYTIYARNVVFIGPLFVFIGWKCGCSTLLLCSWRGQWELPATKLLDAWRVSLASVHFYLNFQSPWNLDYWNF